MKMQGGGVGYYPRSGSPFVHTDTGNVRAWPRMTRQQLLALFPNGNTLHLPADGKPLPGYELAVARRKASGGTALAYLDTDPSDDDEETDRTGTRQQFQRLAEARLPRRAGRRQTSPPRPRLRELRRIRGDRSSMADARLRGARTMQPPIAAASLQDEDMPRRRVRVLPDEVAAADAASTQSSSLGRRSGDRGRHRRVAAADAPGTRKRRAASCNGRGCDRSLAERMSQESAALDDTRARLTRSRSPSQRHLELAAALGGGPGHPRGLRRPRRVRRRAPADARRSSTRSLRLAARQRPDEQQQRAAEARQSSYAGSDLMPQRNAEPAAVAAERRYRARDRSGELRKATSTALRRPDRDAAGHSSLGRGELAMPTARVRALRCAARAPSEVADLRGRIRPAGRALRPRRRKTAGRAGLLLQAFRQPGRIGPRQRAPHRSIATPSAVARCATCPEFLRPGNFAARCARDTNQRR